MLFRSRVTDFASEIALGRGPGEHPEVIFKVGRKYAKVLAS